MVRRVSRLMPPTRPSIATTECHPSERSPRDLLGACLLELSGISTRFMYLCLFTPYLYLSFSLDRLVSLLHAGDASRQGRIATFSVTLLYHCIQAI